MADDSSDNNTSPAHSETALSDPSENPFFILHSDNPAAVLVSPPLNGDNYSTWVRAMRMALRAKNKLGFVTGEISKPLASSQL